MSNRDARSLRPSSLGNYRDRIVSGPILRTLIWLGLPPLLNHLVIVAYNIADAYWLSLYGDFAVAVPRQMWPVAMLLQALLQALSTAGLSMISQYVGGKLYEEAGRSASRLFTISLLSGGVLCILLLALKESIFIQLISVPSEILPDVINYSTVISFDIFLSYVSLTFTTILQGIGDTRKPSIVNAAALCLNIMLDPFFILGLGPFPRLGVIGAALTDVIGKAVSLTALLYILKRYYPEIKMAPTKNIDQAWIKLMARISLPVFTLALLNSSAFMAQLKIVNILGIVAATAYSIGFIILDIVDASLWGLSGATSIMIGQSLGAWNIARASEAAYKSILLISALVALGACIIYPFRGSVADIFTDNPLVVAETDLFLQILLPSLPFFGLFIVAISVGRGSGRTLTPTLIGVSRLWGIRIGLGSFMAFAAGMGSLGAWLAIALSNFLGGIASLFWIKYGDWRRPLIKI